MKAEFWTVANKTAGAIGDRIQVREPSRPGTEF